MTPKFDSALDQISIFRGLAEAERVTIARRCTWRRLAAREQVIGHMESSTDVFFIVQGHLRVLNFSPLGKQVSFVDVGPGEIIGDFAAIDGQPRSTNVVALDDAFIGSMPAGVFGSVIETHPAVAAALLKRLTGIIRQLNERIFELSTLSVGNRIHAELLALARASGIKDNAAIITPTLTHAEIASRVGSNRETVTREINALTKSGIIRKDKRTLIVADVAWLQDSVAIELGELSFAADNDAL
ncbi:MAG: Crp/Fnr family transcriptional regulator [Proteobacteria bacterium]|nr:Crp/Fnr family transcriptional regulator [Pseudomonadota bacterium]MDA1324095.1 Crp/Fnr family transcriptional regulator [Pseudomonadota bacterium]